MHWIQRHILRYLSSSDRSRYSELRPKDVEGNLFMYHLNQMIKADLVDKQLHNYGLTDKGKALVAQMSMRQGKPIAVPNILVIVVYRHGGQQVLYRWTRQPYRGHISFPFGRLHAGWTVLDMAASQLHFKTGLPATDFKLLGNVGVQIMKDEDLKLHYLAHIVEATGPGGEMEQDDLTGEAFWGDITTVKDTEIMPGFREIWKLVESAKPLFFKEITVRQ